MNRRAFFSTIVGKGGRGAGGEGQVAVIDHRLCLAWDGGDCQLCFIQCPLQETAIQLEDFKPVINAIACDGCGLCRLACATVNDPGAIRMTTAVTSDQ
ncbi:MAG: hypothetical protein HY710_06195 [Candidatus Latescibacteria bacterium]|nr:hypothetical protein [Candidatus Latescibacterota bacterium]